MNDRLIYNIIITVKGEVRLKILEFLENSAQAMSDVLFIFSLPYGTSLGRMQYLLDKRRQEMSRQKIHDADRKRFYELLHHLKKDGLVEKAERDNNPFLRLTPKGKAHLERLRLFRSRMLPRSRYEHEKDDILKIVIFDIPEKEKRKRNWLRAVLKNLDFQMLQKSVWAGKVKLPKSLIINLDKLNLSDYVEIFAVNKTGSLKQLRF